MPGKDVELEFPLSGIDVTTEFQEQKPGTTPEAINVRGFDPIARRARGGSRPGIAHYAPDPIPANTSLDMIIQHLAVIVDPHATALPQNFETPGDDWVEDPLNPGTFVPPGGWGNPGGAPEEESEEEIAFVQAKSAQVDATGPIQASVTFDSDPTVGNDVLLFVVTRSDTAGVTVAVVNDAALPLTQVGAYSEQEQLVASNDFISISLWRRRVGEAGNVTLKATPSGAVNVFVTLGALEWSGMLTPNPVDDTTENADPNVGPANMTSGNILVALTGELAIVGFANSLDPTAGWTPGPSQNDRMNVIYNGVSPALRITDKFPVSNADSPVVLTGDVDGGDTAYVSVAASFKSA